MKNRTRYLMAALFLGSIAWAQEADVHVPDVGVTSDISPAQAYRSASYQASASGSAVSRTAPGTASSVLSLGGSSTPARPGDSQGALPLTPFNRGSTFTGHFGLWNPSAMTRLVDGTGWEDLDTIIETSIEGQWHLPYLGNALAVGYTVDWHANVSDGMSFMSFGVGASGRYYPTRTVPVWVGARLVPSFYLLANGNESIRLVAYLDAGLSYALSDLGLDLRLSLFMTGSETMTDSGDMVGLVGLGLTLGYGALTGR
ncbi:MAG TPA: hypothetical protein PLI66_10485 [Spirochaetales bacterium]|nr:hypothetical protein [Spirochaetales bacterium]